MAKHKAATKVKRKQALTGICQTMANFIKSIEKDIANEQRQITAQERLIQQLIKQNAKPELIQQARDRLKTMQDKEAEDESQLEAFQEEFDAECVP